MALSYFLFLTSKITPNIEILYLSLCWWHSYGEQFVLRSFVFDIQKTQNTMQTKKNIYCSLVSVLFRIHSQNMSWSACRDLCVAELVQIFSQTTAAVFCTIVVHKLVHCLRTPVNGWWLQRTTVIHGVDSSSTAEFAHPVIFMSAAGKQR